mmetsp:Transcript_66588/g.171363  ORF Transcript_66588/g.171363 Transcript_66588/m.171363 type:complete len:291 (-) Transcript_66588:200-1072(-)
MDRVGDRFQLGRKLGSGSFGIVYRATDLNSQEEVAVKVEHASTRHSQLLNENRIYKCLGSRQGLARVRHCGMEAHRNVLVLDLLGPSLRDLFHDCGKSLSPATLLGFADQMIDLLEYVHAKGFIHRDIQPRNILVDSGDKSDQLNLIDFGMAKRYQDSRSGRHIPYREGCRGKGTLEFASARAVRGIEQSRRDDLESVGWVLLYLSRGSLPWTGLSFPTRQDRFVKISQMRASISVEELCNGLEAEHIIFSYFSYVKGLEFDEAPDYAYLRRLLSERGSPTAVAITMTLT